MTEENGKTAEAEPTPEPGEDPPDHGGSGGSAAVDAKTDLADALAKMTAERDKLKDQLLRTAADFDNFRKRSRREIEESGQRAREDAIRDLLPVFDNLERAVSAAAAATDLAAVTSGVRMVLKQFEDVAGRISLTRVPTVGTMFDPMVHEAVQQKETNESPPGTIVAEVVPGYRIGTRLVRPAMVVVARPPPAMPVQEVMITEAAPQEEPAGSGMHTMPAPPPVPSTPPPPPDTEEMVSVSEATPTERPSKRPSSGKSKSPPAGDEGSNP